MQDPTSLKFQGRPFGSATQGYTSLGQWVKWDDGVYTTMKFEGGQRCWNGPERSMVLTLECGTTTELKDVSEPAVCEYAGILVTPAACDLSRAEDLKMELGEGDGAPEFRDVHL